MHKIRGAREASACDLPGDGWCLFDLRQGSRAPG
jgi:hypothetical protein